MEILEYLENLIIVEKPENINLEISLDQAIKLNER